MAKRLMNYSYKPALKKHWVKRGGEQARIVAEKLRCNTRDVIETSRRTIFYGVELEMPGPSRELLLDAVGEIDPSENDIWYCKTDGSIPHCGVEIVSQAATERYHLHAFGWDKFWPAITGLPGFNLMGGWDACGMHVHVSRAGLASASQWRLLALMKALEPYYGKIAGRGAGHYTEALGAYFGFPHLYETGNYDELAEKLIYPEELITTMPKGNRVIGNRYHVINLTRASTLELRLFASPKTEIQFWERMEAAWAMVGFADAWVCPSRLRDADGPVLVEDFSYPNNLKCKPEQFFAWVASQAMRFPNLLALLHREGLVDNLAVRDDGQIWLPFVDELNLSETEIRAVPRRIARVRRRAIAS